MDRGGAATRAAIMAELVKLGRPATLREIAAAARRSETCVTKALQYSLAHGLVTRTAGPAPEVGSVRPWLWEVVR